MNDESLRRGKSGYSYSKRIGVAQRESIASKFEKEQRDKIKKKQNGPRATFIEAYEDTKSFERAKEAMEANGFKDFYNDEILKNWIKEYENEQTRIKPTLERDDDDGR